MAVTAPFILRLKVFSRDEFFDWIFRVGLFLKVTPVYLSELADDVSKND
jgi:hypothetical protein